MEGLRGTLRTELPQPFSAWAAQRLARRPKPTLSTPPFWRAPEQGDPWLDPGTIRHATHPCTRCALGHMPQMLDTDTNTWRLAADPRHTGMCDPPRPTYIQTRTHRHINAHMRALTTLTHPWTSTHADTDACAGTASLTCSEPFRLLHPRNVHRAIQVCSHTWAP